MLVSNEVNSRLRKVQADNSGKQSPRPTEFNRTIVNNMFEGDKTTLIDQDQNSTLSRDQRGYDFFTLLDYTFLKFFIENYGN